MAEQSGFFNANLVNGEYDRVYLAENFANYFSKFVGNGVFGGKLSELMVTQATTPAMKIEVMPGAGWINGYWYENTTNLTFSIANADGVLNRIDSVVLQWNKSLRSMNIVIKKGTSASSPVVPAIQRDANIYELQIAQIYVNAGTTSIVQSNITDTRSNTNLCGFVTGLIDQIDSDGFSELLNSSLRDLEQTSISQINSIVDRLKDLVEDESAFAALALEVDDIASDVALANQTIGYSKKNLIPYPYNETTKTSNGITWTDNGDGTITANGTSTAESYFTLYEGEMPQPGKYLLSANISVSESYYAYIMRKNKTTNEVVGEMYRWHNSTPFEVTADDVTNNNLFIAVVILNNTTVSNLVFKPMLRRAEISDASWELYKPSIAEMIQEDANEIGCFYRVNRKTSIKEWINPPAKLGVEYCTTERWEGKPVYQKTFYAASLPNNSYMTINSNVNYLKIISITGFAINQNDNLYHQFPITTDGVTPVAAICKYMGNGDNDGDLLIRTTIDASSYRAYFTIKYVKN